MFGDICIGKDTVFNARLDFIDYTSGSASLYGEPARQVAKGLPPAPVRCIYQKMDTCELCGDMTASHQS